MENTNQETGTVLEFKTQDGQNLEPVTVTHKYQILYYADETGDVEEVDEFDDYVELEETPLEDEQIEIDMSKSIRFHKAELNIGKVKPGEKVQLVYTFEGDVSMIEKVKPSCGCTAEVKINEELKQIEAVYTADKSEGPFRKGINVFLKDGKQEATKNKLGVVVPNVNKAKIYLSFYGEIKK